jgi:hypothetical protein
MESSTIELLVFGSYGMTILAVYFLVAVIYHVNRNSEINILGFTLDPKKASRNRKKISESLKVATREKRMALLWPIFLIERVVKYVKEKIKKEE